MLFDLRGGGRRKTVQTVYILLAVLMGGGLVLFGIGGSVSGGLLDALNNNSGSASAGLDTYRNRVAQAQRQATAHPKDAAAWASLARARFQLASASDYYDANTGQWNAQGKTILTQASDAWEHHLKVAGKHPDDGVASLMVQAYSAGGLNRPADAVQAQEVITQARPKSATFARLAVLAYEAGQTRKGDLAAQKALSLTDKDLRPSLKQQLDEAKQQAAAATGSQATGTPTPAGGSNKSSKGSKSGSRNGSGGK
jgi:hypothetical protein